MPLPSDSYSPGALDLGLGGALQQQAQGETDEMRKKRMAEIAQQQALGPAGSMAVTSLFGMQKPGAGRGY